MLFVALHSSFFSHDTPHTETYTLSLHDALPISARGQRRSRIGPFRTVDRAICRYRHRTMSYFAGWSSGSNPESDIVRSEEHTSELQSRVDLVCRLLLEKKK